MPTVTYEIKRKIGVISANDWCSLELNLVSWNNAKPKYDLRKWSVSGQAYKGITLSYEELSKILDILVEARKKERSQIIEHKISFNDGTVFIYEVLGVYKVARTMQGKVTYTSWRDKPKYDIRMWGDDYTTCSRGIAFNEEECDTLIELLKTELKNSEE